MADTRSIQGSGEEGVHVNVILRCRPPNVQEIAERAAQLIQCNEALREVTLYQNAGGKSLSRTFRYDKVFGPDSYQEKVYNQAIVPIVQEVLDGFNCTIFAYGQTGTGKTYTMEGGPRNSADGKRLSAEAGVIPRAIKQIFDAIESDDVTDSSVKVSFLELYNEELTDLLSVADDKARLRLLEDRSGVVVQGLEEMVVKNAAEIYQVLDRGTSKRRTAETLLNKRSSRSHSIFTVTIHMKETTPEGEDVIKIGKLNLVDLAGSENISRSGAKDSRAREAGNINQSLLTLGRVITALVEHSGHIPYRDSKLTRLLRDSLGGKTKTCIIATIGPSVQCVEETISTLDYAHRAKNIRNRPEVNQRISKTTMIKELTTEIERLKLDLVATRDKTGIFVSAERYEQYELERAQLREMMGRNKAEIEAMALAHAEEMEALQTRAAHVEATLTQRLGVAEQQLQATQSQLADAKVSIEERDFVIMSQQRSEQAIAAHAQEVTQSLGEAASDLSDTFSRLRASLAVTGADRDALRGMVQEAGSHADRLRSALDAAVAVQRAQMRNVAAQASEFRARKQRELEALKAQLGIMEARVDETQRLLRDAVASAASGAAGSISALAAPQREALGRAADAVGEAGEGMGAALEKLAEALEAQAAAVGALAESQAEQARRAGDAAREALRRVAGGVADVRGAIGDMREASGASTAAAGDALAAFAAEFDRSARAREAALASQIQELLGAFVSERRDAVAGAVEGVRRRLADGDAALGEVAEKAAAAAEGCVEAMQVDGAAYESLLSQQLESARAAASGIGAGIASNAGDAGGLRERLLRHAGDVASELQEQQRALERGEREGLERVEEGRAAAEGILEQGTERLRAAAAEMAGAAEKADGADAKAADGIEQAASEAEVAIAGFGEQHAGVVSGLEAALQGAAQRALSRNPPPLPKERALDVPPEARVAELLCPPHGVLLEYFRAERQTILERGGSVQEAFQLLSPTPQSPAGSGGGGSEGENAAPDEASPSARSATSSGGGVGGSSGGGAEATVTVAVAVAAAAATKGVGKRSRIPPFNAASGEGARAGLADMTNSE